MVFKYTQPKHFFNILLYLRLLRQHLTLSRPTTNVLTDGWICPLTHSGITGTDYVSDGGCPGGTSGKDPPCQCKICKRHRFDPWVEGMATHSSILAWKSPTDR